MDTVTMVIDALNLIVSGFCIGVASRFVLRTERCLDRAAKLFLSSSVVVFIASIGVMNSYLGIISAEMENVIFSVSRAIFLVFFLWGMHTLVKITDNGGSCKRG